MIQQIGGIGPTFAAIFVAEIGDSGHLEPAYVGCVTCRRFCAGEDAYRAVGKLGHLPGTVEATRLLVTWEAQDLNVALQLPVDPDGSALVVLDASLGGQVLRWYPLRLSRARQGHLGLIPGWGPPRTLSDPPLPHPIVRLLTVWRLARGGDGDAQARELEAEGYHISWFGAVAAAHRPSARSASSAWVSWVGVCSVAWSCSVHLGQLVTSLLVAVGGLAGGICVSAC